MTQESITDSSGVWWAQRRLWQKPSLNFVLRAAQFFNVSTDQLTRDELELEIDDEAGSSADE